MAARPQILTSFITHSNHVFRTSSLFSAGNRKSCDIFIQDVAHCTCPYHLSRWLRRTAAISSMINFGVVELWFLFLPLMPQIQAGIIARSLQRSRCRLVAFDPCVSRTWSMKERTQASYTLPRILSERCLVVRTGKSFLNFPLATQHLATMALPQPPPKHSMSPT